MKYYKFRNTTTGEIKEFTKKKGLTLMTISELVNKGFTLVEEMEITIDPNFIKFLQNRG